MRMLQRMTVMTSLSSRGAWIETINGDTFSPTAQVALFTGSVD
jgi:hypothetical protein